MMKLAKASLLLAFLAIGIQSCCEPEYKDSFPRVLFDTYRDSMVYTQLPRGTDVTVFDSGYYPIYEFAVKNEGADADTFVMHIRNLGAGFSMEKFVLSGETVTFRTPGPIPDTAVPNAQDLYFTFFSKDSSSLHIQNLQPELWFDYGAVNKGDEACNTPSSRSDIDTRLFR